MRARERARAISISSHHQVAEEKKKKKKKWQKLRKRQRKLREKKKLERPTQQVRALLPFRSLARLHLAVS